MENNPIKNRILAKASTFMLKRECIGLLPNILMSIYCGCWCDQFRNGMRYSLFAAITGQMTESLLLALSSYYFESSYNYLLFTGLPSQMMGNGVFIVSLGYISTMFPQDQRAFRFLSLDIFVNSSVALAYYVGGVILSTERFIITGTSSAASITLHNYGDTFVISFLCNVVLYFWIYFLIPARESVVTSGLSIRVLDPNGNIQEESESSPLIQNYGSFEARDSSFCFPSSKLREIFSLDHLKGTYLTTMKTRPLNFHKTLWWMLLYLNLITLPILGSVYIYYPLVEKLYQWDYVMYSRLQTITQVMKPLATFIIIPSIMKIFKPRDLQVAMVGCMSAIFGGISLASIIQPLGYYTYIVIGCIQGIGAVGVRAFLTQFIPQNEISRLFSVLMTFEVIQPFIGSVIYSNLFALTIDYYPTFAFHFTSFVLIISLVILCKMDLHWGEISLLPRKNSIIVGFDTDENGFGGSRKPKRSIDDREYDIIESP
jgi:hypothetical protein